MTASRSPSLRPILVREPRLGGAAADRLVDEVAAAFREGGRGVLIDLSAVRELDARGLSALGAIHRRAPLGAPLALCSAGVPVARIMRITCLHEIFAIYASVEAAERALAS